MNKIIMILIKKINKISPKFKIFLFKFINKYQVVFNKQIQIFIKIFKDLKHLLVKIDFNLMKSEKKQKKTADHKQEINFDQQIPFLFLTLLAQFILQGNNNQKEIPLQMLQKGKF